jgi:hypothetical protein
MRGGGSMTPRKARPGVECDRYGRATRVEDPAACSMPSIRRELIGDPFRAHLLSPTASTSRPAVSVT